MNVKIKLSIEQFKWLVNYVNNQVYNFTVDYTEMQLVNLKCFLAQGFKKLIDVSNEIFLNPSKVKTFSIEFNQFEIIIGMLYTNFQLLDAYTLSIFETMREQRQGFTKFINFK